MRIPVALARVVLILFLLFGFFINQFSHEKIESFLRLVPYRCPLRFITGWKCAFCGMTHSWIAIFQGEWVGSFHENILGLPLFISTIFVLGVYSFNKKINFNVKPMIIGSLIVMVAYAVLRNIS